MKIVIMIIIIITIVYSFFILLLFFSLFLVKKPEKGSQETYSIVIACRNEENNLSLLLKSLEQIDYNEREFEVILVDDQSTDNTFPIIRQFATQRSNYHALRTDYPFQGKKYALQKGIEFSCFNYIILTDADCEISSEYIKELNLWINPDHKPDMLIGYSPERESGSFRHFTQLITATIFAVTTSLRSAMSCSGRNLVLRRIAFNEVQGYQGLFSEKSGDDKLLLNKFVKRKKQINYFPSPKVITRNTLTVKEQQNQDNRRFGKFFMTRIEWQILSVFVALFYLVFPLLFFNKLFYLVFFYLITINLLVLKTIFLHKEPFRIIYLIYAIIYPYYLLYKSIIGNCKSWEWKK